jgi:N-acyl-D-amino-acid deacylase
MEIIGQDGLSYAPIRKKEELEAIRAQIAGWNGNPDEFSEQHKSKGLFQWESMREYLDCLEKNGVATNVGMLVPQVSLSSTIVTTFRVGPIRDHHRRLHWMT